MLEPHLNYLNVIALGSVICKQMMLDHFSEIRYSIIIFFVKIFAIILQCGFVSSHSCNVWQPESVNVEQYICYILNIYSNIF